MDGISLTPLVLISFKIFPKTVSISSDERGLFSSALSIPFFSFEPSNGCLWPSLLTTLGSAKSTVSNVVNLAWHTSHDLLLLVWEPSATSLESITFVSSAGRRHKSN